MQSQKYEKYWGITLAYTDIHGPKFNNSLEAIVNFIDKTDTSTYSSQLYTDLQEEVSKANGLKDISLRKSINQFVKLGFINFELKSYHPLCKLYLMTKIKLQQKTIFSKIVYENSSLNRDVTKDSNDKEINFLIKTLENIGRLSTNDILALMTQNINNYPAGYLTQEELEEATQNSQEIEFYSRKYNQVNHFKSILNNLDDLTVIDGVLCFEEDSHVILAEKLKSKTKKRDNYLHLLYKNQLKAESIQKIGQIQCMLEKLSYPSLVASHIKPFIDSASNEAYDPNNGLLLSRNMDILFDKGYISFSDDGVLIYSPKLKKDVLEYLSTYKLDDIFINQNRIQYLHYHRKNIFQKEA